MSRGEKLRMAKADTPAKKPSKRSHLEEKLAAFLETEGLPAPRREFRFAPPRLWKFDFCWPERALAVEIEGGIFMFGRHSRGIDFTNDCEKYDIAALLGYRVLRFTVKQFESGWVFDVVKAVLSDSEPALRALLAQTIGPTAGQPILGFMAIGAPLVDPTQRVGGHV